jgi:hypothetical protein
LGVKDKAFFNILGGRRIRRSPNEGGEAPDEADVITLRPRERVRAWAQTVVQTAPLSLDARA